MSNYDFVTPVIIVLIYLVIYIFRKNIRKKLEKIGTKHKLIKLYVDGFSSTCNIKINSLKKSILIPVLITLIVNIIVYSSLRITNPSFNILEKTVSTFISPFSEEIMYRGILLGFVVVFYFEEFFKIKKWNYPKSLKWSIIFAGIMLSSLFFTQQHQQPAILQFFSSILYSLLYLYDNRNLTAPITAHLINNLIANFIL